MLNALPGRKIGMTQFFEDTGKVIPVTVIDMKNWVVTQVKTTEHDGYSAVQVGFLRKRYHNIDFSSEWLKDKKKYFLILKEVYVGEEHGLVVGHHVTLDNLLVEEKEKVSVSGKSIGKGFQGVVKRWGFGGGRASHGSNFHRRPGSIGHMRTQGEVIKGTKLPGHTGHRMITTHGLKIVRIDKENQCLLVKGAVPGKQDSIVVVKKREVK